MKLLLAMALTCTVACLPSSSGKSGGKSTGTDTLNGGTGTNSDTGTGSGDTNASITYKEMPEGASPYGFSLRGAVEEDGTVTEDDLTIVSCFQGRPLPDGLTKEEFQDYEIVEESGLDEAFKDIALSTASSATHHVVLLKLKNSTVSHLTITATDPNGVYCLDMDENDFSHLTIERDCSTVISVHMTGNTISHYNWTPNLWGEDGEDPCFTESAALSLVQDEEAGEPAEDTGTETGTSTDTTSSTTATAAPAGTEYFDLEKALAADGDLSAIDKKLVDCFKSTPLPAGLTAEDARNYAIYDYSVNEIGHATFVNDLNSSDRPRLAYLNLTQNTVSHAHVNLMNERGIYCLEVARNDMSFLNFRRSCKAVVKAKFTDNEMSWLMWADGLTGATDVAPICGTEMVDPKSGKL